MEKVIEVKNLKKSYGDLVAVDNISFDVFKGEIFGILGPNGAGKTTTLEIIETLHTQDSGNIQVANFDTLEQPWEVKKRIGVQLQQSGFYPDLNLVELLNLFAGLYNVKINPLEVLEEFDLLEKKKSQFKDMSGGQKQRFAIASTLINTPEVIFLDEPTTGLDPQARRNLWELLLKIKKKGITVVLTTHYMEEAEFLCDRVAIMDQGKIIAIDTPKKLIQKLLDKGFKREKKVEMATLEDVFLDLTGKELRE